MGLLAVFDCCSAIHLVKLTVENARALKDPDPQFSVVEEGFHDVSSLSRQSVCRFCKSRSGS